MDSIVEINVSQPWFRHIRNGVKTVEGRLNKGKFRDMKSGDVLVISNTSGKRDSSKNNKVVAVVTKINQYDSFEEYLSREGLNSTLPGIKTISEGMAVYRQFYSPEDELKFGIAAVHIIHVSK